MVESDHESSLFTRWVSFARLPLLVAVLLGVITVGQLASMARNLTGSVRTPMTPQSHSAPARTDVSVLVRSHLFGFSPSAQDAQDHEPRQEVAAKFKLAGTIAYEEDPSEGYAIFASGEKDKDMHLFAPGSSLPGGWLLAKVFKDHVLLTRGGAEMIVNLPHSWGMLGAAGLQAMARPSEDDPTADYGLNPHDFSAHVFWYEQLGAYPVMALDGFKGFRLHLRKGFNRQYGLKGSDIITKIDGVALHDDATVQKQLQQIGSTVSLTVLRDGVPQTISFSPTDSMYAEAGAIQQ